MLLPLDIKLFQKELVYAFNNPILNDMSYKMIMIPARLRMPYGMVNYVISLVEGTVHKSIINHMYVSIIDGKYVRLTPVKDNLNPYNEYMAHIYAEIKLEINHHNCWTTSVTKKQIYDNYRLISSKSELVDIIYMICKYNQICAIKLDPILNYNKESLEELILHVEEQSKSDNTIVISYYNDLYLFSNN
jgi:hypothetical protein